MSKLIRITGFFSASLIFFTMLFFILYINKKVSLDWNHYGIFIGISTLCTAVYGLISVMKK
ncbi:MAG: hypothetical protein ACP5NW_05130 [Candidatus Woesearchaeota archaeon]